MTIETIFKIHPFFYVVAFLVLITGLFKEFTIFVSIILFHEMGHVLMALIFKWNIEKIILLPFGCLTIFRESLNKPLFEELLIVLAGPVFQIIFYYFLGKQNQIFTYYHYALLIFNLLPIYPLDGSKIFNILFNTFFSFKRSHLLTIYLSLILLFGIIFIKFNLIIILIFLFLLIKIIKEYKDHNSIFNKFLLERYLYNFKFKRTKIITNITKMQKSKKHLFFIDNKYYLESEILKKKFDNR